MGAVDVLERWGKYEHGGYIRAGGKEWQIVYIMCHHESGSAWLVLGSKSAEELYEYTIDYEEGMTKDDNANWNNV